MVQGCPEKYCKTLNLLKENQLTQQKDDNEQDDIKIPISKNYLECFKFSTPITAQKKFMQSP